MVVLTEDQRARIEANRAEALRRKAMPKAPTASPAEGEHFTFGKYAGKSFLQVAKEDPSYCNWAQKQQNATGQLKRFIEFVSLQERNDSCPSPSQGHKRHADNMQGFAQGTETETDAKRQRIELQQRVQDIARPSVPQRRFFRLQHQYLNHIKTGRKRWEGRLNVGVAAGITVGCLATFSSGSENLEMEVQSVRKYPNFEAMLSDLGVEKCLPDVSSLDRGVSIYHSFPGYAEKAGKFGVIAMELTKPGYSLHLAV
jgi:ASC-1-like (ASCH) protein